MNTLDLESFTDAQIRRTLISCFSCQHQSANKEQLASLIRSFTRQQYKLLKFPDDLRKPQMNPDQRRALREHEIATIKLLLSVQTPN